MEKFELKEDMNVFCITATSFPHGVQQAHESLHALVTFNSARNYFGISYPDRTGTITYKAAAQELNAGELSKHNLESIVIKKGAYALITIHDFMKHLPEVGPAFQKLIHLPDIDPNGFCLEWYFGKDCRCMVRLK